jgi:hypothetical protein
VKAVNSLPQQKSLFLLVDLIFNNINNLLLRLEDLEEVKHNLFNNNSNNNNKCLNNNKNNPQKMKMMDLLVLEENKHLSEEEVLMEIILISKIMIIKETRIILIKDKDSKKDLNSVILKIEKIKKTVREMQELDSREIPEKNSEKK